MKRYAWFAGALLIIIVAIRAVATYQPTPVVQQELPAMPVLTRNIQRADRIQIIRRGTVLNLERRGQVWGLAQNGGYPVKPAMAALLLDQLLALRLSDPSTPEHSELRVENPLAAGAALTAVRVLATDGAGLGALIVADHDPSAIMFPAHQLGDPRDWQAHGALVTQADPMAWVDPKILSIEAAGVTGATLSHGGEPVTLDAASAAARLGALEAMAFSDVHPVAQLRLAETGRLVFALADGGTLAVSVRMQAEQVWLAFSATEPGVVAIPPGAWVFHYPAGAAALLQPPA